MRDRDVLNRIDEVLDESEQPPEYRTILQQKRFEAALQAHARRVAQERWMLQGVELGAVVAVWDGRDRWSYVTATDCGLWLGDRYEVLSVAELPTDANNETEGEDDGR